VPALIDADAVRLVLHGELDIASAPQLDETAAAATADLPMVVDLRPLTFIDSTGMRALLRLRNRRPDRSPAVPDLIASFDDDSPWSS
jgi:anti-anti-sigma factor